MTKAELYQEILKVGTLADAIRFEHEFNKRRGKTDSIEEFLSSRNNAANALSYAFIWAETEQGDDYWRKLYNRL